MIPSNDQENYPIMRTLLETIVPPIIDVASATVTYKGYAAGGVNQADPFWKITRTTISGNVTIVEVVNGNWINPYDQIWTNRASLQYSR